MVILPNFVVRRSDLHILPDHWVKLGAMALLNPLSGYYWVWPHHESPSLGVLTAWYCRIPAVIKYPIIPTHPWYLFIVSLLWCMYLQARDWRFGFGRSTRVHTKFETWTRWALSFLVVGSPFFFHFFLLFSSTLLLFSFLFLFFLPCSLHCNPGQINWFFSYLSKVQCCSFSSPLFFSFPGAGAEIIWNVHIWFWVYVRDSLHRSTRNDDRRFVQPGRGEGRGHFLGRGARGGVLGFIVIDVIDCRTLTESSHGNYSPYWRTHGEGKGNTRCWKNINDWKYMKKKEKER